MKTLEEKSINYVLLKVCKELGLTEDCLNITDTLIPKFCGKELGEAYKDGALEALGSQWRSVEDELPGEDEFVLCIMKSNGAIVGGFIEKNQRHGFPQVATSSDFHFEDYGENPYECTHWMPLPINTPGYDQ